MSKSMGFRNSGKLDLRGKRTEYAIAGALLVVIVVAVVFVVGQIWSPNPTGKSGEPRVKCVKCSEEWVVDPGDERYFNREMGMEMGGESVGADHEKCGGKGTVFLMNRCPECEKYYLSKRITDPGAFNKGDGKEICPYCGTDLLEWHKKHYKRR